MFRKLLGKLGEQTSLAIRLMHRLDQGAYIRTKQEWGALFGNFFTIRRTWTFTSGICFYSAFLLMNKI